MAFIEAESIGAPAPWARRMVTSAVLGPLKRNIASPVSIVD
jgi:hypothetical protein